MHYFLSLILVLGHLFVFGQKPTRITDLSDDVRETSGLLFLDGSFYTFNDSGGEAELYKIDTTSGEVSQVIKVENAANRDWEAITADEENIYIGDIGNNAGNRKDLVIYKCPIEGLKEGKLIASKIKISYSDQEQFENESHKHEYDGEGLFVREGKLYLISKNWAKDVSKIYLVPNFPGNHVLDVETRIKVHGKVTDAYYDNSLGSLLLIGYGDERFVTYCKGFDGIGSKAEITVPITTLNGLQTEGITVVGNTIFYTSEEVKMFKAEISRFNLLEFEDLVSMTRKGHKLKVSSINKIATVIIEKEGGENIEKYKNVNSKNYSLSLDKIAKKEQLYIKVKLKGGVIYRQSIPSL